MLPKVRDLTSNRQLKVGLQVQIKAGEASREDTGQFAVSVDTAASEHRAGTQAYENGNFQYPDIEAKNERYQCDPHSYLDWDHFSQSSAID